MTPPNALWLIDASAVIFRSYFAMAARGLEGPGLPPPVRLAWLRFLVKLRRQLPESARLGVAFDEALGSGFRHALDPAYKAQRPRPDDALKASFRQCRALTGALGIPEAASRRYEADDLLALAVHRGRPRPVVLMSTDKDLLQLLRPGDRRWIPGASAPESYAQLRQALGFPPEAMATYLALTGDASDGIAGVPGIGAKTAARLCARFPDLPTLYGVLEGEGPEALGPLTGAAGIASKLLRGREAAFHALKLTRLSGAVPRRFDPAARALPPLTKARLEKAFHAGGLVGYAL
ncbi:MAG: 5'-3' exonuclease [Pseudomonadales bacterium]